MKPIILYRTPAMKDDELRAATSAGFRATTSRMLVRDGDLVIGRYSVLPEYRELSEDLSYVSARLINSFRQHCYIADMQNWIEDLEDITPKTWFRPEEVPLDEPGSFVLKGKTNSKKEAWSTAMFAKTRQDIHTVHSRLLDDTFIGAQDIYARKYVPLITYAKGIADLPITKEFRFFVCRRTLLTGAYYWSSFSEDCLDVNPNWIEPTIEEVPQTFLQEVINRVGDRAAFYAVDVAQDIEGCWWVIEINDGQMSGLSGNSPETLYRRLYEVLTAS